MSIALSWARVTLRFWRSYMTTLTRRRNQQRAETELIVKRIDSVILLVTLGTLFLVPVVFSFSGFVAVFNELKVVTLHLGASLIAILWLWQIVIPRMGSSAARASGSSFDLVLWIGRDPSRWLVALMTVWLVSQTVSTLLSPLPMISLLGAEDNRSGYNLYDNISLFVIFAVVAAKFRSERRLKLLIYTLVASGTLTAVYGTSQHFGWDPIGNGDGQSRVWSSFGNPLNFGAYMVMSIPATLAAALMSKGDRRHIWLGVLALAVGFQISGLWFSGGRGPYVAFLAALIAFGGLGFAIDRFKALGSSGIVFVGGLIVAIVVIVLPATQDDTGIARILSAGDGVIGIESGELDEKTGLAARLEIWGNAFDTAAVWDTPEDESTFNTALRPVFGLGPDMFVYSYPLVADPGFSTNLVDHAHNFGLQALVEQGFVGLLLVSGILTTALVMIIRFAHIMKKRSGEPDIWVVIVLAIAPAVVGKLIEMQTGVSRVSELIMTFALAGALVAIWAVVSSRQESTEQSDSHSSTLAFSLSANATSTVNIIVALLVTSAALIALFSWDLRRTIASLNWSSAINATSDIERATGWFDAQADAPERPLFTNSLFIELFNAAIDQRNLGSEEDALQLMHTARNLLLDFQERDRFKRDVQINLFVTEVTLVQWGQSELSDIAVERSESIFRLYPAYLSMLQIVADRMSILGRDDLAETYSQQIKAAR